MNPTNYLILSTSPLSQLAKKSCGTASLNHRQRLLYGRRRRYSTGKEYDTETGLYYYGARYLDSRTGRWISGDPAMGDYVPGAPVNDEARKRNGSLPGMGGVFNYVNLHVYHYAGNNPVKYTDPDGRKLNKYHLASAGTVLGAIAVTAGTVAAITLSGGTASGFAPVAAKIVTGLMASAGALWVAGNLKEGNVERQSLLDILDVSAVNSPTISASSPRKDESETAGIIGVSEEEFHKPGGTKDTIIDQHKDKLKDIGDPTNPDILIDKDGKIGFRNVQTGKETWTDTPSEWYGPEK